MGNHVDLGVWPERGGKAVAYAVAFLMLLVLIQWPVGGYSPQDSLPSTSPEQNETRDTDPPAAPVPTSAVLAGPSNENVLITWSLSADDGAGDDDVSHYAIYLSEAYDYDGDGYSYVGQAGSGEISFTHTLAGDGDWSDYFYYVQANDTSGNGNWSGQAGKFVRFLEKGKHLASVPLVQEDTTLEVVLQTLAGSFKHVRYYKSSDQSNHWKTYWTFKTYRTLFDIDHRMGFWIDMTKDDHLVVVGLVPETTQIELGHNWNLVGYPSFIDRTVSDALAGIDWEKVQGWGATPPHHQKQMSASDFMRAGEAYWIWVDLPQMWGVTNKPTGPPYIVGTHPSDGALGISLNASVSVKFSKEMNVSSVTWTTILDPAGYSETWSESNTLLEIHRGVPWPENTVITFEIIYAEDLGGLSLVPGPVPNPWSFTTTFDYPQILSIEPPPGVGIDPHQCFTIYFSEPMDPSSVIVMIVPFVAVILAWNSNYTEVTICPEPQWDECTIYTVNIEGNDMAGNPLLGQGPVPLPFQFKTTCDNPYIVETDPLNGSLDIPLSLPISVRFSEPMNTASVHWTVWPDPGGWYAPEWSENDTFMVLNHSIMLQECITYGVEVVGGEDKAGMPLVPGPVPNPWYFSTVSFCPYIISSDPTNNQTNVSLIQDIVITFSAPMNASTLVWNITPDPGGWSDIWPGPDLLVLTHVNPFQPLTTYVFELLYIEGENGVPLCNLSVIVSFTTTW